MSSYFQQNNPFTLVSPHDLLIRGNAWAHKTSLSLPLLIEVPEARKVSGHIYVFKGINFADIYDFCFLFWNCSNRLVFLSFILLHIRDK